MSKLYVNEVHSKTGSTKALEIDSDGFISKSVMSLAVVGRTSSYTTTASVIPFDKVFIDKNNDFNSSSGEFTCPVDGVYEVSIMVMSDNTNTTMDVELQKNGTTQQQLVPYQSASGGVYNQVSGMSFVDCVSGDVLRFRLNSGEVFGQSNGRHSCATFRYIG